MVSPRADRPVLRLVVAIACIAGGMGCSARDGINSDGETFDAVADDEVVTLVGNEPFWNVRIEGEGALWTSPDDPAGTRFTASRFAGNNGLGFSGQLRGERFTATLTPGECSDGMSDRTYPFTATIALGDAVLYGCGYTTRLPFAGAPAP